MPLFFRQFGLVFMPGEPAIYKPDDDSPGIDCTVVNFVDDGSKDKVVMGYWIIPKGKPNKPPIMCSLDEIIPKD